MSDFVKVLLRRWYIVVAGMALIGGAAVGVAQVVPTNYEASGTVLILLPPAGTTDKPINPYLNTPQGLTMAALIIGGVLSTPEEQRTIFGAGFTSQYAVGQSPGTGVPLLYVTVEDTNPDMAVKTLDNVFERIDAQLAKMQDEAGAPTDQRMIAKKFSVTRQAEAVAGAKMRALAVVAGVGGILTLLTVFGFDRWRRSHRGGGRRERPTRRTRKADLRARTATDAAAVERAPGSVERNPTPLTSESPASEEDPRDGSSRAAALGAVGSSLRGS